MNFEDSYQGRLAAARESTATWRCSGCGFERPWEELPARGRKCLRWHWFSGRGPGTAYSQKFSCNGHRCCGALVSLSERAALEAARRLGGEAAEELVYVELRWTLHEAVHGYRPTSSSWYGFFVDTSDLDLLVQCRTR